MTVRKVVTCSWVETVLLICELQIHLPSSRLSSKYPVAHVTINDKPAACNRIWIVTQIIRQHLPQKKGLVHGLHKTKIVNKAAVRLMAEKLEICWIFHSPWVSKPWPIHTLPRYWRWKNLHCIVAPTIAIVSRQAMGNSDANGGNFGWIQSLRRCLAMKLRIEVMIVIVEVVMEKRWIVGILCTVGCLKRFDYTKCICLSLTLCYCQFICFPSDFVCLAAHSGTVIIKREFCHW